MKTNPAFRIFIFMLTMISFSAYAGEPFDTSAAAPHPVSNLSFLVVPYKPMMHLSDADNDLSRYSEKTPQEIREELRMGLLKNLNTKLVMEYEAKVPLQDFVENDDRDLDLIYNSLAFEQDTIYPMKENAIRDSMKWKKNIFTSKDNAVRNKETSYVNVGFYDQQLLPDLARKYNADYFIFLNELDIKTHFEDCLDLALKIYQRELKVHYSIFDRKGKQVYGDVAIVKFPSNSNDVDEIIRSNFPGLSDHIIESVKKVNQNREKEIQ